MYALQLPCVASTLGKSKPDCLRVDSSTMDGRPLKPTASLHQLVTSSAWLCVTVKWFKRWHTRRRREGCEHRTRPLSLPLQYNYYNKIILKIITRQTFHYDSRLLATVLKTYTVSWFFQNLSILFLNMLVLLDDINKLGNTFSCLLHKVVASGQRASLYWCQFLWVTARHS